MGSLDTQEDAVKIEGPSGNIAEVNANNEMLTSSQVTNNITALNHFHEEIHNGKSFFYSNNITLDSGYIEEVALTTGSTVPRPHFNFIISATDELNIELFEGSSLTTGAALTSFNLDRDSATTATMTLNAVSSITSDGTEIYKTYFESKHSSTSNRGMLPIEMVLKKNTVYLFRITSLKGGNDIGYLLDWYETNYPA